MFAPTTFGKYFLLEKIATGGMAEIYRGKLLGPQGFEKQLVIKQIHPRFGSRPEFVQLFVAEAKTTVSLSHGNIVPVYELGVVDGTYFIAMEYIDGPTLVELERAARGKGRQLSPPVAAYITAEILKGLDYAHRKGAGVIHRDLSPRNVMVAREGEVKILDFGLAATLETAAEASAASSGNGRPVGSFPYMSPEQARREPLDPRSDLFSVGILLWEMLTGDALFARPDEDETLRAVREQAIPAPSTRAPEVPPALDAVCLRALERNPEQRWQNAADFLAALGRYLYSVEPGVTPARLSTLVGELCPDVPHADDAADASGAGRAFDVTNQQEEGATTRAMTDRPDGGRPGSNEQHSFATHIELEKALVRNATPMMPFRALADAEANGLLPGIAPRVATPPPDTTRRATLASSLPSPAPSRRSMLPVILVTVSLAALALASVLYARNRGVTRAAPDATVALRTGADAALVRPADAGVIAVAGPDAAMAAGADADAGAKITPIKRPGKGHLVLSAPAVAWATVYMDGKDIGTTPFSDDVAAGLHRFRIVCRADVCPPNGTEATIAIDVPANGRVKKEVALVY